MDVSAHYIYLLLHLDMKPLTTTQKLKCTYMRYQMSRLCIGRVRGQILLYVHTMSSSKARSFGRSDGPDQRTRLSVGRTRALLLFRPPLSLPLSVRPMPVSLSLSLSPLPSSPQLPREARSKEACTSWKCSSFGKCSDRGRRQIVS